MNRLGFRLSCLCLLLLASAGSGQAQPTVHTATLSASAGRAQGGGVVLHGTSGQAVVGPAEGSGYRVYGGFWPRATAVSAALFAPSLLHPADGAEQVTLDPVLQWAPVSGAETYHLQLALDGAFASLRVDTTGVSDTALDVPALHELTRYYWRVRALGGAVTSPFSEAYQFTTASGVSTEEHALPQHFSLSPNYPNPFRPSTRIEFAVPQQVHVLVTVYDALGREVATLVDAPHPPGRYTLTFDAGALPSGAYLYRIQAGEYRSVQRMVVVR
jgi:hypothetical protein